MDIKKMILEMLEGIRPEFDFSQSEDFIVDGFLDSFDVITITSMLEEKFSINIDGLDIIPENYDSVDHIIELVRKSGGKI